MLTFETSGVFGHFAAAIFRHASWIEDSVVVLNAGDVTIEKEEMVLISIVFVCEALTYLTNQVQITVSLTFLPILPSILVLATVLRFLLGIRWTTAIGFSFVVFEG